MKNKNNIINNLSVRLGTFLLAMSLTASSFALTKEKVYANTTKAKANNIEYNYDEEKNTISDNIVRVEPELDLRDSSNLEKVTSLELTLEDNYDYSFLNNMTNLEHLIIVDNCQDTNILNNIDGSVFSKPIDILIVSSLEGNTFTEEKYGFLKDIETINRLQLGMADSKIYVDSKFLESLKNVHELLLSLGIFATFNATDFSHLERFYINMPAEDAALYFSDQYLKDLEKDGVIIDGYDLKRLHKFNKEIDSIIDSFNLPKDATDLEKINAITKYVLEEYSYDEEVASYLAEEKDVPEKLINKFYKNGALTGAMELDSQICGNYTGMTYALCKRLGIETYNMMSDNHIWNAVVLDDYCYYIDTTLLDTDKINLFDNDTYRYAFPADRLRKNLDMNIFNYKNNLEILDSDKQEIINHLDNYLEDPNKLEIVSKILKDDKYDVSFLPDGLTIRDIPDKKNIKVKSDIFYDSNEIFNDTYKKVYLPLTSELSFYGICAISGLVVGIGLAHRFPKKRKSLSK